MVSVWRAREDARRATEEIAAGPTRDALHGIPIGLKDVYDTAGTRTAAVPRSLQTASPRAIRRPASCTKLSPCCSARSTPMSSLRRDHEQSALRHNELE